MKRGAAQLINQDSGDTEYYTPQPIIEAARRVMGGIDLDPFSSAAANERVKAGIYFHLGRNGLVMDWHGRVWMNHPFSRDLNSKCVLNAVEEYESDRVKALCCITFAATSEQWFQPLLRRPQCYLSPRTNYHLPDGRLKRGVTKGSVVTYFGGDLDAFAREFAPLGVIKIPYGISSQPQPSHLTRP